MSLLLSGSWGKACQFLHQGYPVPSLGGTVTALFPGKGDILIAELFGFLVELDGPNPDFQDQEVLSPD